MVRRAPGSTLFPYTTLFRSMGTRLPVLPIPVYFEDGPRVRPRAFVRTAREERQRSEEHTSELQSRRDIVCRLLLEKKKRTIAMPDRDASRNPAGMDRLRATP